MIDSEAIVRSAGLRRRLLAFLIDVVALYFPISLAVALLVDLDPGEGGRQPGEATNETDWSDLWWVPVTLAVIAGVFSLFWYFSRSPGMLLLGLKAVSHASSPAISPAQAVLRGTLTGLFLVSSFLVLAVSFSDPPSEGYNSTDFAVIYASLAVFVLGLLGYLWSLFDRKKLTFQDRLAGVSLIKTRGA
ncbi:MAG TPA: RDD family protein [Dehalococcoidia bacterium]|nr:RDD family protein [Dehalococcoidia bacterium]